MISAERIRLNIAVEQDDHLETDCKKSDKIVADGLVVMKL
jgi:hypothetical protein